MRNSALLLAVFCMTLSGCGGGGHTTPPMAAQKPTAGTAKLSIVLPKGLKHAAIPTAVHAPNHGLRKHGVVKRPKTKTSSTSSKKRNPLFIDTTGANTFLQITSQSVQNGIVVASTTVTPDVPVGSNASLSVAIPIYAGSGNIIVREVDETNTPFVALAQGQQTYSFDPAGGSAATVDIALSMIPAGVAVVSSAPDFPGAQQINSGSGTPTINISDFNNCNGSMSGSAVTFTAVPIDALGTLPNGDGAVPSVTVAGVSDNGGTSSLTPATVPGQYTLNYDAAGDGVTATFKSTDAFNDVVTTTADLTDTCTSGNGLSISTDDVSEFSSGPDTITFTSPQDSPAAFTPLEIVAIGQVFTPTVLVTDDGNCTGLLTYDTSSTFSTDLNGYTPVNVTPTGGSGSCNIFFNDGKNATVTLSVVVNAFSSPPPSTGLSVSGIFFPIEAFIPQTLQVTDTAASPYSSAPVVTFSDSGTCNNLVTVNSLFSPISGSITLAINEGAPSTASANITITPITSAGSCTLDLNDGTNDLQLSISLAIGPPS